MHKFTFDLAVISESEAEAEAEAPAPGARRQRVDAGLQAGRAGTRIEYPGLFIDAAAPPAAAGPAPAEFTAASASDSTAQAIGKGLEIKP